MTDEPEIEIPQFLRRQANDLGVKPVPEATLGSLGVSPLVSEGPEGLKQVMRENSAALDEAVVQRKLTVDDIPGPEDIDWATLEREATARAIEEMPRLSPFFIENWHPALRALSVQTEVLAMAARERDDLLKVIEATMDEPHDPWSVPAAMTFAQIFEMMIKAVGGRAFVRLGSRSPKDNPTAMDGDYKPIPVYSGRQAVEFLSYSERVLVDLLDARRADYNPAICVRRWIDMEGDQEFRCFVEDGDIVGITQYYLDDGYSPWIEKNQKAIEDGLRAYLNLIVRLRTSPRSLTADIIMSRDMRPTLLEINPPVSWGKTFPGLFKAQADLDGSFRFVHGTREGAHDVF